MAYRFEHFTALTIVQGLLISVLAGVLPGLHVENLLTAILGTGAIVATTGILWPFVYGLAARARPIFFPLLVFVLSGAAVVAVSAVLSALGWRGLRIDGLGTGIVVALALAGANSLFAALFADDDWAYDRNVTRPILRAHAGVHRSDVHGVLFLEIDGLATSVLSEAIAVGRMPTLKRWQETGSHIVTGWEPDLSSQTAASQAGILLGRNDDIPAFRWYDRTVGQVLVSSHMATAALVEERLSTGAGLLADGGASRCNMFSGDATDCLLTFSAVGHRRSSPDRWRTSRGSYYLFFANPYTVARLVVLLVYDVCLEVFQAWRQRLTRVRPRTRRAGAYPLLRAFATAAGPEIATYMVISDLARGVPALYATYYAYDEVAHHSGIRSADAMGVLRRLDRHLERIERATRGAPRPYHIVVLSDHGQSNGAPFRQRSGETLARLVGRLIPPSHRVVEVRHGSEVTGHLNAALNEALTEETKAAGLVRRAAKGRTDDDEPRTKSADDQPLVKMDGATGGDVVVLASGNLGLVYFTNASRRMTSEEITAAFPELLPGLIQHEGIGFVRVHAERDGPVVFGRNGVHFLDSGRVEGEDPLASFGRNAAAHLRRHDRFTNGPDILVNSTYWVEDDEVAAFEELVGSHGGLGGTQTQPFVFHPTARDAGGAPIVGTAALHAVLKRWVPRTTNSLHGPTAVFEED